jgi:hypothetical protein
MSNKKQTAVEWLIEKLKSQGLLIGEPDNLVALKQAKEMDRNNIINAAARGYLAMPERFSLEDAKEYGTAYYENTFNIDKENKG